MSGSKNPFGSGISSSSSKRFGKAVEKSNFAQTCNLLSQYVKQRGSLRDLNLAGMSGKSQPIGKPEESKDTVTTLNLLPSSQQGTSVDPFSGFDPLSRKATSSKEEEEEEAVEAKKAQMTIFYAGEVIVFDDFPAEKAKEIMCMASSGGSGNGMISGSWKTSNDSGDKSCTSDALAPSSKAPASPVSTAAQESLQQSKPEANTSDLPIARRSSLHRFLAKRKDRAAARGPYQLHNNYNNNDRPESSSKNDQEQLELKL